MPEDQVTSQPPRRRRPPDRREILLRADRISRRFGGLIAVRDVDLVIPRGGIVSIIGPNGAGKTTFFNVVAGIIDPTAGTVSFRDQLLITRPSRLWLESILWLVPSLLAVLVALRWVPRAARPGSRSRPPRRSASWSWSWSRPWPAHRRTSACWAGWA